MVSLQQLPSALPFSSCFSSARLLQAAALQGKCWNSSINSSLLATNSSRHTNLHRVLREPWGPLCGLQGKLCTSTCSSYSPSFSHLGVHRAVFHTVFPHCCLVFFPFLNSLSLGPAMPCGGSVGVGWNWQCPAWGSPDLASQGSSAAS